MSKKSKWIWWTILSFLFTLGWGLGLLGMPPYNYTDCPDYSSNDQWERGKYYGCSNTWSRANQIYSSYVLSLWTPILAFGILTFLTSLSCCALKFKKDENNRETRNPGAVEFNSPRQEVRNLGTETDTNHEIIELSSLGQETRNLEAETIDIEQTQNQQITELQRRLTQLENQINQQQEARIEVVPSSV